MSKNFETNLVWEYQTMLKGENLFSFLLQEGCGVTVGWSICQCPTYMGRDLLVQSLQRCCL